MVSPLPFPMGFVQVIGVDGGGGEEGVWGVRSAEGEQGVVGGVDVEEVTRPEIK